jgi:NAD(P)-dependent dehydrogenase (short-subunit alcohol dehydrogenase family)
MRLAGKIGIVTAAASGMGRAGALRFAREGRGSPWSTWTPGRAASGERDHRRGRHRPRIIADLTKDEDSRRIVWDTVSRFKGLDFVWDHVGHPGPPRSRAST